MIIDWMKEKAITNLIMAGKIKQVSLFDLAHFDKRALRILSKVPTKQTTSLLGALTEEFEKEGFHLLDSHLFVAHMLPDSGCLTKRKLSEEEEEDVSYGFNIAKEIGRMDIGQTVVLKDKTILAVEAIEGTNAAIERAASFGGEGIVVVKVSRPNHDMRFDISVIGYKTIEVMAKVKARVLAVEAGKTLFIDQNESIALAEKSGISIVAR